MNATAVAAIEDLPMGVHREVAERIRQLDKDALWFWGRLRDFERGGILDKDCSGLISQMTETMREDCERIMPKLVEWLGKASVSQ